MTPINRTSPSARASVSALSAPCAPSAVDLIDAEPFERSMQTCARAFVSTIAGLGREKEAAPMLAHPRSDPQLRFAVRSRGVDMVDAVFQQHLEHLVCFLLLHTAERGGAKNHSRALMTGFSKRTCSDHLLTSGENHRYRTSAIAID